jgi:hypothetical protein
MNHARKRIIEAGKFMGLKPRNGPKTVTVDIPRIAAYIGLTFSRDIGMLLLTHAGLMVTGFMLMAAAIVIARYARVRKWWFKVHRALALTGFVVMILGFFAEALQLSLDKNEHFAVPHAYLGLVVFILALTTILLGQMQMGIPEIRTRLRKLHAWAGRGTWFLAVVNITVGLSLLGLI